MKKERKWLQIDSNDRKEAKESKKDEKNTFFCYFYKKKDGLYRKHREVQNYIEKKKKTIFFN